MKKYLEEILKEIHIEICIIIKQFRRNLFIRLVIKPKDFYYLAERRSFTGVLLRLDDNSKNEYILKF